MCIVAVTGIGATIQWYSQQPVTTTFKNSDVIVLETTGPQGYKSFTLLSLKGEFGTNGVSYQYITNLTVLNEFHGKTSFNSNLYVTNLFLITATSNYYLFDTNIYNNNTYVSNYFVTNVINNAAVSNAFFTNFYLTNLYLTNLTVTNYYQGSTFLSEYFNTNIYINEFVSNYYVTNLFTNVQQITTNLITQNTITNITLLTVSNAYFTNLFISQNFTNFYLYNTNIYNADTFVSNYFTTNVFQNTYMSNFFLTNLIFYDTNYYVTYVSTTNFLSYITNNFVSNFFNTNIFVNNSYVSNYFTTNYNPLIQYISNYTFNVAWPLTNATLYGTTTFSPVSGTAAGRVSLLSSGVETISLAASNGAIAANAAWFKTNLWSGPTNNLPMNAQDQYYTTSTDINITNLNNLPPAGYGANVLLSVSNSSAANIVWRFPSTIKIPENTNAVVVSNGTYGELSLKYSPVGPHTQAVYRQFP